jgi:hypothetical protein
MNPVNPDSITAVYRYELFTIEGNLRGYKFTDQDGIVLRKKATRPYTHMAVQRVVHDGAKFLSFHSTGNPKTSYRSYVVERVIAIQEKSAN